MVGDEAGGSPAGAGPCRTLLIDAMPGSLGGHLSRKRSCSYEGAILNMGLHHLSPPDFLMYSTRCTQASHHSES